MPALKNHKHERFCREVGLIGTPQDRAYESVYGARPIPWRLAYLASRLMAKPEIQARIAELRAEFQRDKDYAQYVIEKALLPAIEANPADAYEARDLFEQGERLKPITKMDRRLTAAITRIKIDPESGRTTEIAFAPKVEAATALLKACGAMTDKVEHNIAPELASRLGDALARRGAVGQGAAPRMVEVDAVPDDPAAPGDGEFADEF